MLGLIGTIGVIGCISAIAAVVSVVGTAVTVGVTCAANAEAQDAAERQERLQEEAMQKAEDRAKADKVIQKKLVARNLLKARQSVGTSIAYEKVIAARARREAAKTNAEMKGKPKSNSSIPTAPEYYKGNPVQQTA